MIREWLKEYNAVTRESMEAALREIMQEITLAGLYRSGFFDKAAFYGGTALRIVHGLDRFSEDLDFSLLEEDPDFSLEHYFRGITEEFAAAGLIITIKDKRKTVKSSIDSAFLKAETIWKELVLDGAIPQTGINTQAHIRIKIEVDRKPPPGFATEEKLLLRPYSFYVKCFSLPDLFAGKMHALLFRKWKDRVKGRDWYDMEWYIRKGVPLHLDHFIQRARDSGNWKKAGMSQKEFLQLLINKINSVVMDRVKEDAIRFIPDSTKLDIWSVQYFTDLAYKIRFQ